MRILTFKGKYSYRPEESFLGFICFCHFEAKDTSKKFEIIAEEINTYSSGQKIILVPFSHLHESVLPKENAQKLFVEFEKVLERISGQKISAVLFGVSKELNLNIEKDDTAIKFFHF